MAIRAARARWLALLPGGILTAVAAHQIVQARTADLSAWWGGGFGMFSTADAGIARHLHAFVLRPGILREVEIPGHLEEARRRALTLPSEANLRALARELVHLPTPDYGPARAVRLQVWRTRWTRERLTRSSELLRSVEVPVDGG